MFYGRQADIPVEFRGLARILGMLTQVQGVRAELVQKIRKEIEAGQYLTEEKLNTAIHRLLREIMTEEERV